MRNLFQIPVEQITVLVEKAGDIVSNRTSIVNQAEFLHIHRHQSNVQNKTQRNQRQLRHVGGKYGLKKST
jgi:hypothetical protein